METYTGVTGNKFKERFNSHKSDFRHEKNRHNTTLANHIWNLKNAGTDYQVKWSLVDRAGSFNPTTQKCRVCLKEKYLILYNQTGSSLNKRNEIFNTCDGDGDGVGGAVLRVFPCGTYATKTVSSPLVAKS